MSEGLLCVLPGGPGLSLGECNPWCTSGGECKLLLESEGECSPLCTSGGVCIDLWTSGGESAGWGGLGDASSGLASSDMPMAEGAFLSGVGEMATCLERWLFKQSVKIKYY